VRGFFTHFAPDEFRPDEISILEDAFEDAWRRLENSKAPWASEDYSTAARTILARYIIEMAQGGERDPKWLADSALLYISQRKLTRKPSEGLTFGIGLQPRRLIARGALARKERDPNFGKGATGARTGT